MCVDAGIQVLMTTARFERGSRCFQADLLLDSILTKTLRHSVLCSIILKYVRVALNILILNHSTSRLAVRLIITAYTCREERFCYSTAKALVFAILPTL